MMGEDHWIYHRDTEGTEDFLFFAHRETTMGKKNNAQRGKEKDNSNLLLKHGNILTRQG